MEENKAPARLRGRAIAIQQHQDIIAVNYPARSAGVTKHMRPHEVQPWAYAANSSGFLAAKTVHTLLRANCVDIVDGTDGGLLLLAQRQVCSQSISQCVIAR